MGCQVGLLIFQLDALVQPGGGFLHLSRWWNAQCSVTPLTHPAASEHVCVSEWKHTFGCVCVCRFVSEIFIHHIHYIMFFLCAVWVKITLNQSYRIYVHTSTIATCTYIHPCVYAHTHTHSLTEIDNLTLTCWYKKKASAKKRKCEKLRL